MLTLIKEVRRSIPGKNGLTTFISYKLSYQLARIQHHNRVQMVVAAMLFVVAAILVWYVPRWLEKQEFDKLEQSGNSLAILLAEAFEDEMQSQGREPAQKRYNAVQTLDEVVFAAVVSEDARVVSIVKLFS